MLSSFIPEDERIVTIEDAAELQLHQEHVLRLESRPPNIEGKGEVKIRDLVRNSLRMRPDRIVVGEIRDAAALDMLQAMNTGHDGSICTVHANAPRDVLARVETMVLMAGIDLPVRAIREQVASAIDLIVHQTRFKDGTRHITHVTEVVGMEGDVITLQDLFLFDHGLGLRRRRALARGSSSPPGCAPSSSTSSPRTASRSTPRSSPSRSSGADPMSRTLHADRAVRRPSSLRRDWLPCSWAAGPAAADPTGRISDVESETERARSRSVFSASGLPDGRDARPGVGRRRPSTASRFRPTAALDRRRGPGAIAPRSS